MNNNKKTILYLITQSELGGAQSYVFDLAVAMKEKYNVIVCYGEQGSRGELAQKLKKEGIDSYTIKNLQRKINIKKDISALFYIIKILKAAKPDIIHLNSTKISILGSIAGKIYGKAKIIYTAHGWVFNEKLSKRKMNFYIWLEKFTANFKDAIICVSNFDYKSALDNEICKKEKLYTIHNGIIKPVFFEREMARKELFGKINFISDKINCPIIIGSIGNLYKNKGFDVLVRAGKILAENNLNFKIIIIGEGEGREDLLSTAKQLRIEKYIALAGRIEKASKYLKAFDYYICSSIKEGLSFTLIEAMMAELPIAATDAGGNTELISHENNGLIIPRENSLAIASAVITLINNPQKAKMFAENARKKAEAEFQSLKMLEETEKLYV